MISEPTAIITTSTSCATLSTVWGLVVTWVYANVGGSVVEIEDYNEYETITKGVPVSGAIGRLAAHVRKKHPCSATGGFG